ncbi:hemolysin family protein [Nocardioides aurantiacus]|uniref:CBS domain containing-hemolysin-like protein n=1 Tax=Nocardioides aurantiacus TaxID=86796 RepID=A0A3N2CRZ3_9ACTN|nr:hemolysin family protein [Nocardioides aurantiacus]ROR90313.1 CBS domain containing-hemolysin-like protein [Nocardioides aurantiacus]
MDGHGPALILTVVALVALAAVLASTEAATTSFSRARALELAHEQRPGAVHLLRVLDDPARHLNALLFLRLLSETAAVVLATAVAMSLLGRNDWSTALVATVVMFVVLFVVIGVGPRTIGRQRAEAVSLATAGAVLALSRVLGPLPRLLILVGNALTPGKGFSEGPFGSEAELREMVDLAEASSLIESDESRMIHSVFELGDTSVREVMVPRTDVVYIERQKTLRQAMSLFLRSGYSRVPVVGESLDDIIGFVYLKDVSKRVFDRKAAESTEDVEHLMRPVLHVPDSKPADDLLREMQAQRRHIAVVVDEYGGTAGIVTIEDVLEEIVGEITDEFDAEETGVEILPDGARRVPARFPVDDLEDLVGVAVEDEDVDSVGGLMAKHLGVVPIPGSTVEVEGLQLTAEEAKGRRKKIGTVLVRRLEPVPDPEDDDVPEERWSRSERREREREDRGDRVRSSQT